MTISPKCLPFAGIACLATPLLAAPSQIFHDENGQPIRLELAADEAYEQPAAGGQLVHVQVGPLEETASSFSSLFIPPVPPADPQSRRSVYYPAGQARSEGNRYVAGRHVVIRVADTAAREGFCEDLIASGFDARCPDYSADRVIVKFASSEDAFAALPGLEDRDGVAAASVALGQPVTNNWLPNDPLFDGEGVPDGQGGGTQWYIDPKHGGNLGVSAWWGQYRGSGVRVNVVDSGVEVRHPDLSANCDTSLDKDYMDDDSDPTPLPEEDHGTAVAGIIGGRGNNGKGICGLAPESTLVGVRLNFAGDMVELSDVLSHKSSLISVSNNSWGVPSYGWKLFDPGDMVLDALQAGVADGRGGRGVIYVYAAGNSGDAYDEANRSKLQTNPYVLSVGALNPDGTPTSWTTPGACVHVANYGESITTTSTLGQYIHDFNGTSAAAPLTSGVVALMLDARPTLNWRDVHEILMRTAAPLAGEGRRNRYGLTFSNIWGAGQVQGERAIRLARRWQNLPAMSTRTYAQTGLSVSVPDYVAEDAKGLTRTINVPSSQNMRVESVQLTVNCTHLTRGDLEIELTSPSGMVSRMLTSSPMDTNENLAWTMKSVQFWGENSAGNWKVKILDQYPQNAGKLTELKLKIYGSSVQSAPTLSGGYELAGSVGEPVWHEVGATGNPTSWSASGLPAGLQIDDLGLISGIPAEAGSFPVTISAANLAGVRNTSIVLKIAGPLVKDTWLTWQEKKLTGQAPEAKDPQADPDGDGVANYVEFAQGSEPLASDAEKSGTFTATEGGLQFTWQVVPGLPDADCLAQTSSDLQSWEDVTTWEVVSTTPDLEVRRITLTGGSSKYVRLIARKKPGQ